MLSILELNVGHAIIGSSGDAAPIIDMLGQGDGIKVCAQWFARARRKNSNAEIIMHSCAEASHMVAIALRSGRYAGFVEGDFTEEKAADLIAYIFERGVNLGEGRQ